MTQRQHSSYGTTITWKVASTPTSISVVPSASDGLVSLLITVLGGLGLYWVANRIVEIENKQGLMLLNWICISTPALQALVMGGLWYFRDKRPFILVDLQTMKITLPRSGVAFSLEDSNATFVHDVISSRGDDTVCEFNLVFDPGENEKVHPILRNLGKSALYERLGQTLKAAGFSFQKRNSII